MHLQDIIDADNFKSINDTYGHAAGDMVLQRIADVVKKEFRSMDYICRIGGDEFTVIMVDVSRKHRDVIARKLTSINKELSLAKENTPAISLSMGVAFSDRDNPGESIFKDADSVLYKVKENGRNGYRFYE